MKPFGQWFNDFKLPETKPLPDCVYVNAIGQLRIDCCACEKTCELPCDVNDLPLIGYKHYCNGTPSCTP